jgi:hypothetical protein
MSEGAFAVPANKKQQVSEGSPSSSLRAHRALVVKKGPGPTPSCSLRAHRALVVKKGLGPIPSCSLGVLRAFVVKKT